MLGQPWVVWAADEEARTAEAARTGDDIHGRALHCSRRASDYRGWAMIDDY